MASETIYGIPRYEVVQLPVYRGHVKDFVKYPRVKPRRLVDIPLPVTEDPVPIDERIKHLLRALVGVKVPVIGSCEGHMFNDRPELPYPWISIWRDEENEVSKRLQPIIDHYNDASMIRWRLKPEEKTVCMQPVEIALDSPELHMLQRNSELFARFIFDEYIRGNPHYFRMKYILPK